MKETKMTKEKSLGEKREGCDLSPTEIDFYFYRGEDVAEAVEKLKEELADKSFVIDGFSAEKAKIVVDIKDVKEKINKIMGEFNQDNHSPQNKPQTKSSVGFDVANRSSSGELGTKTEDTYANQVGFREEICANCGEVHKGLSYPWLCKKFKPANRAKYEPNQAKPKEKKSRVYYCLGTPNCECPKCQEAVR